MCRYLGRGPLQLHACKAGSLSFTVLVIDVSLWEVTRGRTQTSDPPNFPMFSSGLRRMFVPEGLPILAAPGTLLDSTARINDWVGDPNQVDPFLLRLFQPRLRGSGYSRRRGRNPSCQVRDFFNNTVRCTIDLSCPQPTL